MFVGCYQLSHNVLCLLIVASYHMMCYVCWLLSAITRCAMFVGCYQLSHDVLCLLVVISYHMMCYVCWLLSAIT